MLIHERIYIYILVKNSNHVSWLEYSTISNGKHEDINILEKGTETDIRKHQVKYIKKYKYGTKS